jgi:hypothetical protein
MMTRSDSFACLHNGGQIPPWMFALSKAQEEVWWSQADLHCLPAQLHRLCLAQLLLQERKRGTWTDRRARCYVCAIYNPGICRGYHFRWDPCLVISSRFTRISITCRRDLENSPPLHQWHSEQTGLLTRQRESIPSYDTSCCLEGRTVDAFPLGTCRSPFNATASSK